MPTKNIKLSSDDIMSAGKPNPLDLFHSGIKTHATDETYTKILKIVLCTVCEDVLSGTFEERACGLVERARMNPMWVHNLMYHISQLLRERTELPHTDNNYLNPSSVVSYFAPVKKLLDMNDISVPWRHVFGTFPSKKRAVYTRGWRREEIQKMLRHACGIKHRALILVIASSGVRVGGLDLNWGDLVPIVRDGDSMITESHDTQKEVECIALLVHRNSNDEYITFITPEAYSTLMEYKQVWQQDVGRPPCPDDPVFKKNGMVPDRLNAACIESQINKILHKTGLRQQTLNGRRYSVPALHGFRLFWAKIVKDAISDDSPLSSLTKKEYMMGHMGMTKLDRNYYHTHMLELAKEYIGAVPALTIDDAERLRMEGRKQRDEMLKVGRENIAKITELEEIVTSFYMIEDSNKTARTTKPIICSICNHAYDKHTISELAACGQEVIYRNHEN